MFKNKSLLISIFVVVFLMVIAGGIATSVLANNRTTNKVDAASAVATYQSREAEYQALLAQANNELEQANQQITALANTISTQSNKNSYPVTPETAMAIAYQAAGDYPLSEPDLVNYNGAAAYEVRFKDGTIYVDATSGEILSNGIQAPASQTISAEEAARIAVAYIGNGNIQAAAVAGYNGSSVYQITFANGQVVYVSLTGTILAVKMPSTNPVVATSVPGSEDTYSSTPSPEPTDAQPGTTSEPEIDD